jgi:hypothetical protein
MGSRISQEVESAAPTDAAASKAADSPTSTAALGHADVLRLQRQIGNRAVRQLMRAPPTKDKPAAAGGTVQAEDAKTIIDAHLGEWYQNARWGIEKASLSGPDEAMKWFLVALGGNLLWAATAFLNPAAAVAIRVMSVAGATIGSGTLAQMAAEDKPIDHFKQVVVKRLSDRYGEMKGDVGLTTGVLAAFERAGLMDRSSAEQAQKRREVAWQYMFKDTVPMSRPAAIEDQTKANVEAIWAHFLPTYKTYFLVITPEYIRKDRPRYILGAYYRALVTSGVVKQMLEVEKQDLYKFEGDYMVYQGTIYKFGGGVRVLHTPQGWHDFWFGEASFDVPDTMTK